MAADQLNFQLFTYTDNNGQDWNKRGEDNTALAAIDGSTAFGSNPAWGRETARHRTRKVIFRDGTTFRTKSIIVYTTAAFASIVDGTTTLAVHVPGNTAAVTYTAYKHVDEKSPGVGAARQLADHP